MQVILTLEESAAVSDDFPRLYSSHEALRRLVKDLLVELMSKETENSKELIERAQKALE